MHKIEILKQLDNFQRNNQADHRSEVVVLSKSDTW